MESNKKKTRSDLLKELESIKGLLLDDHDIPVLQEIIEHKSTHIAEPPAHNGKLDNDQRPKPTVTDRPSTQQQDTTATGKKAAAESALSPTPQVRVQPQARGENPFLPQHIRARLRGNRMDFSLPDISDDAPLKAQLINQIIKDLLPELESQLRKHLLALTDDTLQQLVQKAAEDNLSN